MADEYRVLPSRDLMLRRGRTAIRAVIGQMRVVAHIIAVARMHLDVKVGASVPALWSGGHAQRHAIRPRTAGSRLLGGLRWSGRCGVRRRGRLWILRSGTRRRLPAPWGGSPHGTAL